MQKTSSRGVQEADVWAAADALIAQGLRPTIERVRQHIGRGSPNTVSPMLETWFATLGQRLGVAAGQSESVASPIPDPVQRLAQELWSTAQQEAMEAAHKALELRETLLQTAQQEHEAQQEQLSQREVAMQAQKEAMDQALQVAQTQSKDLSRRLDEMQQQLQDRDQRLEEMRDVLSETARQREDLLNKHGQEIQTAAQERQRLAEQYAGNERHMLNELDRARQELAAARKTAAEQERKADAKLQDLLSRHDSLEQETLSLHAQLQSAQNMAALAQQRASDLKSLLEAQRSSSGNSPDKTSLATTRRSMSRIRDRRTLR
ncbi:DNA-binding protein [Comamonas composti]|uniref:DNA-binding protein n=1 Tax=Comamonas composti TaxID=408558 RepID=UPI00041A221E|nr:DNA-binding protein [Comamonas composti]